MLYQGVLGNWEGHAGSSALINKSRAVRLCFFVRRNVMGGLGLLQEQIGQRNFEELGADGWEITAHANSAPDHEPVQGRQFKDEEFRKLNNSLKRRIGTMNCGHMAFPVVVSANTAQYTDEELAAFREENERGVTYEGRHYTGYEATQVQRKLEQSIRRQKRRVTASEATGDAQQLAIDKARLTRLNQEYARFSKAAGLRTERERMWVAGIGGNVKQTVAEQMREAEAAVRDAIRRGDYPLTINPEKQARHMAATATPGRSVITISQEELQEIINSMAGSGELRFVDGTLKWKNQEIIDVGKEIGYTVNTKGDIIPTRSVKIHYSKTGIHAVPFSGGEIDESTKS